MTTPYLQLFRFRLRRLEKAGELSAAQDFLEHGRQLLRQPHERVLVSLETARLELLLGHWEQALNSLDEVGSAESLLEPSDRSLYHLLSARLHQGYGDLNQALTFLEMALAEVEGRSEGAERQALIEALIEMGALFHRIGERERGEEFLQRAQEALGDGLYPELTAQLEIQRGLTAFRSDLPALAEEHYQRALSSLEQSQQPSLLRGEIRRYQGVLAATHGHVEDGIRLLQQALEDFRAVGHRFGCAKVYNSLGQTCLRSGRYAEARFFLEQAESLCRLLGAEAERATILGKLGRVFAEMGQFERAIDFQQQDLEVSSRFGNYRALAHALRNLGLSYRAKGDHPQAVVHLQDSRDRFAELEDAVPRVHCDLDLVSSLLRLQQWDQAAHFLADAMAVLEKRLESTSDHVHAHYYAGLLARQQHRYHEAESCLYQAFELSQGFAIPARRADILIELAELALAQGDSGAAVEHLRAAYPLADSPTRPERKQQLLQRLHELSPSSLFELLLEVRPGTPFSADF